jgi:hypothetical protein
MAETQLQYAKSQGKANPAKGNAATSGQVYQMVMAEAQRRGYNWFKPHHALGMIGSFVQETGNFRRDVLDFDVRGDDGTAHGLMQWRGPRFKNLLNFANQNSADPRNLQTQISFAFEEGSPGSPFKDGGSMRAFSEMSRASNLEQATVAFVHAERPAGYTSKNPAGAHDISKRISHAQKAAGVAGQTVEGDQAQPYQYQANGSYGQGTYDETAMGAYPQTTQKAAPSRTNNAFGNMFDTSDDNQSKVASMVNNSRNFADDLFKPRANPFDFNQSMGVY